MFDRSVEGEILEFGVSGLLYESNLVMYDRTTESLWSQSTGESIAGDFTGTRLDLIVMQVLEFSEVAEKYPDTLVLSTETGYSRDYTRNPYSGYDQTAGTYFPITVDDERFFSKELFWVFWLDEGTSVALRQDTLGDTPVEREIEGVTVTVERDGGEIIVEVDGDEVPGYIEMWFSWATHHQDDGVVWDPSDPE